MRFRYEKKPLPKPTYADMWRNYEDTLQQFFATKQSFYAWVGQRYNRIPAIEKIVSDRRKQLGN